MSERLRLAARATAIACVAASLSATACVHQREKPLAILPEGALAPDARGATTGPRPARRPSGVPTAQLCSYVPRSVAGGDDMPAVSSDEPAAVTSSSARGDGAHRAQSSERARQESATALADHARSSDATVATDGLVRHSSAPPAHQAIAADVSLEQVAREAFLSCDSSVVAEKAAVFVPARYAPEIQLTGLAVESPSPGRRVASAGALRLRRLTVRAASLTVTVRDDGREDFSIQARGDVSFDADRPASVIAERHLKMLLVTNDRYTPLR